MDIFLTGSGSFRPDIPIDTYESLVWTDRYASYGDFQLKVKEDYYFNSLRFYKYLVGSESNRVMMIENVSKPKQDENGESLVTVTGNSIEAFLQQRNNKSGNLDLTDPEIFGPASVGAIARFIVFKYCVDASSAGAVNVIPYLQVTSSSFPGPDVTMQTDRGDIYGIVKSVCDTANLGFMIRRDGDNLLFQVYDGLDRSDPTTSYYMEYSPNRENIVDPSSIESIAGYKNHARVLGNKTGVDVFLQDTLPTVSGFERRTIVIEASDVGSKADETDPTKVTTVAQDQEILRQRGREALADPANRYINLVDGEIPQHAWPTTYYGLGDIVIVKDRNGIETKSMITETIWTSDATGRKRLPTFTAL